MHVDFDLMRNLYICNGNITLFSCKKDGFSENSHFQKSMLFKDRQLTKITCMIENVTFQGIVIY